MKAILLTPFTRSQVTEGFQYGFSKVAETRFLRAASFVGDFLVGAFTFRIFFSWQPLKEKKPFERLSAFRLSGLVVGARTRCCIMIYSRRLLLSSRSNVLPC
jgi:hypothetical protein